MSDVVRGVEWAARNAAAKAAAAEAEYAATGRTAHKGSVANMSLGGGKSRALEDVVNRATETGLHFAVAAGVLLIFVVGYLAHLLVQVTMLAMLARTLPPALRRL